MKTKSAQLITAMILGVAVACDQTQAKFPGNFDPNGISSACGSWYPGGDAEDGGTVIYAVSEGATFPCLVWNSVRQNQEDIWFNAGELYLEARHDARNEKALLLLLSSEGCPTCRELITRIEKQKGEFEEAAVMLAAALPPIGVEESFSLDRAESILVGNDGWPTDWMITNDEEGYLTGFESFPWIIVVRLSDMQVVAKTNLDYGPGNISELLAFIQGL